MEQQQNTISYNPILDTDSYKPSHYLQLPPGAQSLFGYIESRGGMYDQTLFFGLQYILARYLSTRVTYPMIEEAKALLAAHGEPFNEAGWRHIVDQHCGRLPLEIRAVPEGSLIPNHNTLVTIRSTDPEAAWLEAYMETMLLRVWYPITVATQSWSIRQVIRRYLEETSDNTEGQLPFKLHDFGARGVSSEESAGIGGMAHLVNFMGTDTLSAIRYARAYYDEPMAGYSIPASEHSTITAWGKEGEVDAYRNMLRQFGGPGKIFACVADSYDIFNAVENLFGGILKEEIIASQGMVIVRPDSGNPVEMARATAKMLQKSFGSVQNRKGFAVLNHTRIIYGDGINETSIRGILMDLRAHGFSADNIAFGMGGALLQQVNRDTQKMAMKTSAILMPDGWRDVYKAPVTDPGKTSKKGLLSTYHNRETGEIKTWRMGEAGGDWDDLMRVVWRDGNLVVRDSLALIRERAAQAR